MKKIIYSVFTLLLLGAAGCSDDFFDINENPNSPTEESITPQLILPRALHATAARMATSYDYAAHWMGYWSRSGTYGPSAEQESYAITTSYQADEWSGWYDILKDADLMEKKAIAGNDPFYNAAAKVIKSIGFMYLVDQYNNVPYTNAFDFENNILPSYDSGQDIYNSLLDSLEVAATLIESAEITPEIYSVDVLFGGPRNSGVSYSSAATATEKMMWRKLINTQRLKLLVRQSEVFGGTAPTAELARITSEGAGFLGTGESASVQPGYAQIEGQQNPFYDTYESTVTGTRDQYNRANNYVLDKLRQNNDIRYQYYFSPAATPLNGNTYYGYNFGEIIGNDEPKQANSSDVSGPGLAKSATQPQWLFTSVESLFLQAEATQRGWLPGDAETAYENAVTESFIWLGATRTDIITPEVPATPTTPMIPAVTAVRNATYLANEYLAQETAIVDYEAAGNKINLIVTQKYLGLVGINNFEAWVDYRRVGVPSDLPLSLSPNRGQNVIPSRLLYPQNEYNYNAANVGAQGTVSAQTSKVFWDK